MLNVFKRSRNVHIMFIFRHFTVYAYWTSDIFLQKKTLNFHFNTRNHFRDDITRLVMNTRLLGGLSLHLNHLIASGMTIYDWPFGTLSFRLFGSNLDTMDLETYPRTYSGYFWNMSIFDNSRVVWVLFRKWVVSENQSSLNEGAIITPYWFSFRRRGP